MEAEGFVNISFEIVTPSGKRDTIIRESHPISEYLDISSHDIYTNLQRMIRQTNQQILNPSVPKDML